MTRPRAIPALLLDEGRLVKTTKFRDPRYVGDPINAVRIFNDKEVDEVVFLDISATRLGREPDFDLLKAIASEAFMPFAYGGGISSIGQVKRLLSIGIEKVILNTAAGRNPQFVAQVADVVGSSGVVVAIDVKRTVLGRTTVNVLNGREVVSRDPVQYARQMEALGAGELLLQSVDREGTGVGLDTDLVAAVVNQVTLPVIASGGVGELRHFKAAFEAGASAVAAGSFFVFKGKHKAVLITYPDRVAFKELGEL